jgi:alpha-beta hydrolase superfamily lysophospholipase
MSTPRQVFEHHFTTHDGLSLFYRRWPAVTAPRRGCVVMFHRGHEHSGRMAHLVDELDLPDFDFFAWDARGYGLSPGTRGFSPSLATSVRDVQSFIDHIAATYDIATADMVVLAQSVAAVVIATWAHDYAPDVRCLVLASPAFKVKLYVPFARAGLRLMLAVRGSFFVNSYVKARFLTHDPARQASYDADPLITRPISVNILLALYEAADRVVADAQAIVVPTQVLISGDDWVVHLEPEHRFYDRLGSAVKEKHVFPGFYHDTLGEKDRYLVVEKVRSFIKRLFAARPAEVDLLQADRHGATRDEALILARPLPLFTPRGLYWAAARLGMKVAGWWSEGVRLGHATGFDSGATLDYIYRNQATGRGGIGRLIDRNYLDAIGWRGIRQRKAFLEELLGRAMRLLQAAGQPARLLDIAAGHGRYVLEAVANAAYRPQAVLLRDFSESNVHAGRALIRAHGLSDIAHFERADAFDPEAFDTLHPQPNIGVVSGLYELFPENDAVRHSLAGLARAIAAGGYLIYTNQPWHPQLEQIARTLTSHRGGRAWVMRRRSQAEMDQLVAEAGFTKLEQRIDEWGIFTVCLAQRRAP